jgi:leader peptidase (prepilin peptidase)/N-methyltransferase
MFWPWLVATLLGGLLTPPATFWSLRGLDSEDLHPPRRVVIAATLVGVVAGAGAYAASAAAHSKWWLPGLFGWAIILGAAAVCDAETQRIPTPLVRFGGSVTLCLLTLAMVATRDWRAGVLTVIAAVGSGLLLAACWRFAGAGFGDVRLAALGGLGLGHASRAGLASGIAVFAGLTLVQGIWTLVKTRNRHATLAYGPALAACFLVAAAT